MNNSLNNALISDGFQKASATRAIALVKDLIKGGVINFYLSGTDSLEVVEDHTYFNEIEKDFSEALDKGLDLKLFKKYELTWIEETQLDQVGYYHMASVVKKEVLFSRTDIHTGKIKRDENEKDYKSYLEVDMETKLEEKGECPEDWCFAPHVNEMVGLSDLEKVEGGWALTEQGELNVRKRLRDLQI